MGFCLISILSLVVGCASSTVGALGGGEGANGTVGVTGGVGIELFVSVKETYSVIMVI